MNDERPAVLVHDVSVRFGSAAALQDVSLRIGNGEKVAVLGPSGAGKSTLLAVLNGSVRPTSGSVTVLGHDLDTASGPTLRRVRSRIGTVSQTLDLVGPLRVVHNVNAGRLSRWSVPRALWSLVRPQGTAEVRAALDRVGIADRIYDRCDDLSGGQQQRVALARLLLQDPDLVLADEPVSSLDPALAARAVGLLTEVAADGARTLVASLHDPALAVRFCDRVLGLREGRLTFDLPAAAVDDQVLDRLYDPRPDAAVPLS